MKKKWIGRVHGRRHSSHFLETFHLIFENWLLPFPLMGLLRLLSLLTGEYRKTLMHMLALVISYCPHHDDFDYAATQENHSGDLSFTMRVALMLYQQLNLLLLQTIQSALVPLLCVSLSPGGRMILQIKNRHCCCIKRIGFCGFFMESSECLIIIML